jgi:hypothetical protein
MENSMSPAPGSGRVACICSLFFLTTVSRTGPEASRTARADRGCFQYQTSYLHELLLAVYGREVRTQGHGVDTDAVGPSERARDNIKRLGFIL